MVDKIFLTLSGMCRVNGIQHPCMLSQEAFTQRSTRSVKCQKPTTIISKSDWITKSNRFIMSKLSYSYCPHSFLYKKLEMRDKESRLSYFQIINKSCATWSLADLSLLPEQLFLSQFASCVWNICLSNLYWKNGLKLP